VSVYTAVSDQELRAFLHRYMVGDLLNHHGITAGIENTNYFVYTTTGRFVLTLFERSAPEGLPFCLNLMAYLAENGIPSAHPVASADGVYLQEFLRKPAVLVQRLAGASIGDPDLEHCRIVGETLAHLHNVTREFPQSRDSERGVRWHAHTAARVRTRIGAGDRAIMDRELSRYLAFDASTLPQGVIHADLFRDNVLFDRGRLSGLIDFYYAHTGPLLYDLAVVACDWCFDLEKGFHVRRMGALLSAYQRKRAIGGAERSAWASCLRAVGLRFWLSRLDDKLFPRSGAITHIKDPERFKAVLEAIERQRHELDVAWA
jgi:homoserine kinase type II